MTAPKNGIGDRAVRHVFFELDDGVCFQDDEDRLWFFSIDTGELKEILIAPKDPEAPIVAEAWSAYGTLAGLVVLARERSLRVNEIGHGQEAWILQAQTNSLRK